MVVVVMVLVVVSRKVNPSGGKNIAFRCEARHGGGDASQFGHSLLFAKIAVYF